MNFTNSPYEPMMKQKSYIRPRLPLLAGDRVRGLLPGAAESPVWREVTRWPVS